MNFYDRLIEEISAMAKGGATFPYAQGEGCKSGDKGGLILSSETAFEFGGSAMPGVGVTLFSTDNSFSDEVIILGEDIKEISSDTPYARIALISLDSARLPGEDDIYKALKDIEFTKYRFYPEGCLLRLSAGTKREQLRISKKAKQSGLSLKNIGFGFIDAYKKNPAVKAVKIIFITEKGFDYKKLRTLSEKANRITESLNRIFDGMEISCNTCEMKPLCDEVEGMKELHFRKGEK